MPELPKIAIYTDGGCSPNPGPGGWGAILVNPRKVTELSGGDPDTTNNRMELTAAVEALRALKQPCAIDFYTDSEYLRKGITQWIERWAANGWRSSPGGKGRRIANGDLWQTLYHLTGQHTITWHWVKGHSGDPYNERADALASAAIPRPEPPAAPDSTAITLCISGQQSRGPFGAAAAIVRGGQSRIIQHGHPDTTSNHFTLETAILLLEQIPPDEPVRFYTNNSYLYDGITRWVEGWRSKGWARPEKFRAEWQALDRLNRSRQVTWIRFSNDDAPEPFRALKEMAEEARRQAAGQPPIEP